MHAVNLPKVNFVVFCLVCMIMRSRRVYGSRMKREHWSLQSLAVYWLSVIQPSMQLYKVGVK